MSNNSIDASQNIDAVINEIRLTLSASPSTPFIIVEGDDDIEFLRHHCLQDVVIRKSFKGKPGVSEVLERFPNKETVIGVCDRDYDDTRLPARIFSYDYSCLETMLLSNETVTKTIFIQLNLRDSVSLEKILIQLLFLSSLRKLSFTNNLGIRFDGLRISSLFCHTNGINRDMLLLELRKINNEEWPLNSDQIRAIEATAAMRYDIKELLAITQGHDLIHLIQCYHAYNSSTRGRIVSEKAIRPMIYCAYAGKFHSSTLYKDILQYSEIKNIAFLVA